MKHDDVVGVRKSVIKIMSALLKVGGRVWSRDMNTDAVVTTIRT